MSHEAGGGNEKGLALDGIFFWARLGKEGALPYIWVRFPRTRILAKMWHFFEKSRAFVRPNLIIFV